MTELARASCEPCRGGVPPMTSSEIQAMLPEVSGWAVREVDGVPRLERDYTFPDFKTAMAFAVRVGELAEEQQHHPDLHVGWGRVRVETWTHKIHGLHRNDFILAAKVEALSR
jgi:4a-hydroxytetrahydrobiopterin dehydratase